MASNVEECNIYNNNDECIGCKDGFFLKNDLCVEIATEYNCRQMGEEGTCLQCIEDFILEDGKCLDPLDYKRNQCENDTVNGIITYEDQTCNYCMENSVPFNYKDSFVCVENTYMKFI